MNTEEMRALPLNEKIKRAAESCCDGEAFGLMEMAVEEAIEIGTRVLMEKNARIAELECRLGDIAELSHNGGLICGDMYTIATAIRVLTLPYWNTSGTMAEQKQRAIEALNRAEKERQS